MKQLNGGNSPGRLRVCREGYNSMGNRTWAQERERIKQKALEKHERLSRLFLEDRLAFERERRHMIEELISSVEDEAQQRRLRALQESWDRKMKRAGSNRNRFLIAQTLFWEHFHKNWHPAIKRFQLVLRQESDRG